jgi:hypothetical protein
MVFEQLRQVTTQRGGGSGGGVPRCGITSQKVEPCQPLVNRSVSTAR